MTHTTHLLSQARLAGWRWQERILGPVSRRYFQQVTLPVAFWRACGCPAQFTPRLPWWQPFVYRFLVLVGRRPVTRCQPRRR